MMIICERFPGDGVQGTRKGLSELNFKCGLFVSTPAPCPCSQRLTIEGCCQNICDCFIIYIYLKDNETTSIKTQSFSWNFGFKLPRICHLLALKSYELLNFSWSQFLIFLVEIIIIKTTSEFLIKQVSNKDLLSYWSTGNSTQYSVMTYMGKESKKKHEYMYLYN